MLGSVHVRSWGYLMKSLFMLSCLTRSSEETCRRSCSTLTDLVSAQETIRETRSHGFSSGLKQIRLFIWLVSKRRLFLTVFLCPASLSKVLSFTKKSVQWRLAILWSITPIKSSKFTERVKLSPADLETKIYFFYYACVLPHYLFLSLFVVFLFFLLPCRKHTIKNKPFLDILGSISWVAKIRFNEIRRSNIQKD